MRISTDILVRNNVQIKGNPDASQTLLFAHGFGTDHTSWNEVCSALSEDYRLILFDYVGANETTVSYFDAERYNSLRAFADDLLDLVEILDLKNIVFVGHSMGGMTGILAAIQEPARFSRLILLSSSPRYLNDDDYTGGFTQQDLNTLFAQMTGNYYSWISGFAPIIAQNANKKEIATLFARTLSGMRPDVGLSIARTIFQSDHRADLSHVPHPVLVLQPQHDAVVPLAVGQRLAQDLPNGQLSLLDAEGHLPHLSHPELVVSAIRSFIEHVPVHGLEPV